MFPTPVQIVSMEPSNEIEYEIQEHVRGQRVMDLGAGDLTWAKNLCWLGAREVIAVDKDPRVLQYPSIPIEPNKDWYMNKDILNTSITTPHSIKGVYAYFQEVNPDTVPPVVFLSWPQNYYMEGLLPLVERAEKVIYLGTNLDGSECGFPALFEHFLQRRLIEYVPTKKNSLLVLGERLPTPRKPTLEETGALDKSQIHKFDPHERINNWVKAFCSQHGLSEADWGNLSAGKQFQVLRSVPCNIRCFRVGEDVFVKRGEECSECGTPRSQRNEWEHLLSG